MRMWWTTAGSMDPMVRVGQEVYRVTAMARRRYLVTRRRDGVRMGIFCLVPRTPWRLEVTPIADERDAAEILARAGRATQRAMLSGWE
jgi:hypothetical protein